MSFVPDEEQLDWIRRASRGRGGDYPIDRDDLRSAAWEALWIAWQLQPACVIAYAIVAFIKLRSNLIRRSYVHRKVFNILDLGEYVHLFQDEASTDPLLVLMAQEQAGRQWEGPACKLCGTLYGKGRVKSPKIPRRIHGLCYACDQRRRRIDRALKEA